MQTLKENLTRKKRVDFRKCNDPTGSEDIQDTKQKETCLI